MTFTQPAARGTPRGIARQGPPILSYGFRPFFLGAGAFAPLAMTLWIGALAGGWPVGGSVGAVNWHGHEMLFGYAAAALAGFILTAVPNWTGRLPVSGLPLLGLFLLWLAGRLVMLAPDVAGLFASALIEAAFLPVLAVVVGREVIAGRNWRNLRVLGGIGALGLTDIAFHMTVLAGGGTTPLLHLGVGLYVMMIALIGGRIVPSFTHSAFVRAGLEPRPRKPGWIDHASMAAAGGALLVWSASPEGPATAVLALLAAALHAARLVRWGGAAAPFAPLLAILHVGYAFVPLGLLAIALSALGLLSEASAMHVLTAGAIGIMTLAVMTRASLGHTGRPLVAPPLAVLAYAALIVAALLRPAAEVLPALYLPLLTLSASAWIAAFVFFLVGYAPILVTPSLPARPR